MSLLKDKIELDVGLAELRTKQTLDSFPKTLRWILIVSLLAAIPAYYLARSASERYWTSVYQKNYGLSAKPSFTNPQDPKRSSVSMVSYGNNAYGAALQITNPNIDLSLAAADYKFSFKNAQGQEVYSETGKLFLLPNDQKYVVVPRFTSPDVPAQAEFAFTAPLHWQKKASIPTVDLQANQPNTYNQILPPAFVAEGNYYNNSPYQLKQVRLTFVVFNSQSQIVGVSRRDDFTVAPYERRSYKQLWPGIFSQPGDQLKIFAETNTLDPANLSLPQQASSTASDLSRPTANPNR